MKTQAKIILDILSDGEFHCSSEFYAKFIADPRRRLFELKEKGYELEWEWCDHKYHKGNSKKWRLVAEPPNKETPITKGEPGTFKHISEITQMNLI